MLGWECNCYKYTALCFLSAKWKQEGPGGNVGVISIRLCVFLSAEWKQKRTREGMLGWECNCY